MHEHQESVMNDTSDQGLDRLIAAADPLPNTDCHKDADAVWSRIADEQRNSPTPLAPRRHRKRLVALGAVITSIAALTAAAPFIPAHTGEWTPSEWISAGGPGENYRLNGSDFATALAPLAEAIPYPDQASRARSLRRVIEEYGDEEGEASTGALRGFLARGAICAWSHSWQAANTAGNQAASTSATEALRGALTWSAVTDLDPHPTMVDTSGDVPGPTIFGYLPAIIKATDRGHTAKLSSVLQESDYCFFYDDRPSAPVTSPGDAGTPAMPPGNAGTPDAEPAATTPPTAQQPKR
jgi:hypothetical protein